MFSIRAVHWRYSFALKALRSFSFYVAATGVPIRAPILGQWVGNRTQSLCATDKGAEPLHFPLLSVITF